MLYRLLVLLVAVVQMSCLSKRSLVQLPAQTTTYQEVVDKLANQLIEDRWMVGLSVALIHPKGVEYYGYGKLHKERNERPDADSIFEIGSVSKTFTALLLAHAVQQERVSLHAPVTSWANQDMPFPSRDGQAITAFHLATHSSGLPRLPSNLRPQNMQNPYADYTAKQLKKALASMPLQHIPGKKVVYSNLGMGLLGYLLTEQQQKSYQQMLSETISKPLGMTHTSVMVPRSAAQQRAQGYDMAGELVADWDMPTLRGMGEINSSARDLSRFVQAQLEPPKNALGESIKLTQQRHLKRPGGYMGLGWHTGIARGGRAIWHNGGTGGFRSFVAFDPSAKVGVVVLCNSASSLTDRVGVTFLRLLQGKSAELHLPKLVDVDPAQLKAYAGTYQTAKPSPIVVRLYKNELLLQLDRMPLLSLYPHGEREFFAIDAPVRVTFKVDEQGKVIGLSLFRRNTEFKSKRLEKQP